MAMGTVRPSVDPVDPVDPVDAGGPRDVTAAQSGHVLAVSPRQRRGARLVALVLSLTAIFVLGMVAVELAAPGADVAAWWPAAGVAVALLLRTPARHRMVVLGAIVVVSGLANMAGGRPLLVAACFGLANATEAAVVVGWFTRRGRFAPRLFTSEDVRRFIVAAILGATAVGVIAGLTVASLVGGEFWVTTRTVVTSHIAAVLVIAPLGLEVPRWRARAGVVEATVQWVVLVAVTLAVFGPDQTLALVFVVIPLFLWGVRRFRPRVVSLQLLSVGVLASVMTTQGNGPFAAVARTTDVAPETAGWLMQAFLVTTALVALPLMVSEAERRRALQEATSQRAMLENVLAATTGTSIVGTDVDGTITFFNPGAENMLGYEADEMIGHRTPELLHDPDEVAVRAAELGVEPGFRVFVHAVDAGAAEETRDWTYLRRDGSRLTVSLTVSAMRTEDGEVTGYLGVAQDVSEERRIEQLLRDALEKERDVNERLAHLDRVKTDLISSVSHELRTPITSVLGYTELLQRSAKDSLDAQQQTLLNRVDRSGRRLLVLIQDLLTMSSIESGTFSLESRRVDMAAVLDQALELVEPQRSTAGTRLELAVPPGPIHVAGDADQLVRVVVNLLTNAIKFTPDTGRVTVTLRTEDQHCHVLVGDDGIGIPVEEQDQLFTRFFRSTSARDRSIPGTGLGLSIARAIVTGHGGRIGVESTPGRGTIIDVCLPLEDGVGPVG